MFMYTHMGYSECVAIRRPLASGDSLLPLCGSWGLNPSRQTWKQASLPAEPSHWPTLLSVSHVSWLLGSFAKKRLQMKTWRASCWFPAHSILPTRSLQPCGHPFPVPCSILQPLHHFRGTHQPQTLRKTGPAAWAPSSLDQDLEDIGTIPGPSPRECEHQATLAEPFALQ